MWWRGEGAWGCSPICFQNSPSPLGGEQLAKVFCQASVYALQWSSAAPKSLPLFIGPVPALLSQNLKASTLSKKARNTAVSPFPLGEVQLSLLAPDVKEQL